MKKNNSKSIRLSDKTLSYIENYRGTGFNQKFEYIILDAMESEAERNIELNRLNEEIVIKTKELIELETLYREMKRTYYSLTRGITDIHDIIKSVIQKY